MTEPRAPRVLKANAIRNAGSRIAFDFEDVQQHCDQQLERARERAREIVAEANREAAAIRETAHREARTAGVAEGLADAEREIERRADALARAKASDEFATLAPALERAADLLASQRDRWIESWEHRAVELGVAIAERILRTELATRPERVRTLVSEVLRLVAGCERVTVRLNPTDVHVLGDNAERLVAQLASCGTAEVVADGSLDPGDCLVETRHGTIDARIATQLDRIASELQGDEDDHTNREVRP